MGWNDHLDPDEDALPDLLNYLVENDCLPGRSARRRKADPRVRQPLSVTGIRGSARCHQT
jgi:hypothetical protein